MPTTGSSTPQTLFLYTSAGVLTTYATKAAFQAAGWDLTWQDESGAALSSQPTWTMAAGASGRHVVTFDMPTGPWTCKIAVPAGYFSNPQEFYGEGLAYDAESIYGALIASTGVPTSQTSTATSSTIYDGDSINIVMSVPEATLTALGAANLAACTMTAHGKLRSKNSDDAADVTTFTEAIVTDTANARTVRVSLASFPSAFAVADNAESTLARIDLRLTYSGQTIVGATHDLTVAWKAST